MKRDLPKALLALAASVTTPAVGQAVPPDSTRLFAYDSAQALDLVDSLVAVRAGVRIYDLTYASPRGGRVTATLLVPAASDGPFPALLFGHWGYGNRFEFLPEAELWARAGVVALLPDYPWVRPAPWRRNLASGVTDPEVDRNLMSDAIVDLRRGLDLLAARPDVDPTRIAYVGHSYGAQWGAVLSAVDDRVRAAALVAGVGRVQDLFDWDDPAVIALRTRTPAEQIERYVAVLSALDASHWAARAAPTPLLLQFGLHERGYSRASMERYAAAASEPKRVLWYATGHELNDPQALADRAAWLRASAGFPDLLPVLRRRLLGIEEP
jgi:cephalosporin-C deacetylase-like acetyl esterase